MKSVVKGLILIFSVIIVLGVLISLIFGYKDKNLKELKEKYATAPSAFIAINGMDVHYRDEGNPLDTLPLILIHGTGASLHTFDTWTKTLKTTKRILRMDLPGFGLTGPFPNRQYTIEHYVGFLEDFLIAKGIQRCILGGSSLGGQIAWRFTAKHPTAVEKLILIDAAGYPLISTSVPLGFTLARIPILKKLMTFITPRFIVKASVENVYADHTKVTSDLVDRYFDLTLREGNRQALVDRMKIVTQTDPIHLIKNIQQATLILWGQNDLLLPLSNAYRFHKDLPNDTLVILDNVGHLPMEESPDISLVPLVEFLKNK